MQRFFLWRVRHASSYSNYQINKSLFIFSPCPYTYILRRNNKLFTRRIFRMEATSGNARQEKIRATRRKAVFKKFKQPVCQFRCISFASRTLDIAQSVISRSDLHTGVSISRPLVVRHAKKATGTHHDPFILTLLVIRYYGANLDNFVFLTDIIRFY